MKKIYHNINEVAWLDTFIYIIYTYYTFDYNSVHCNKILFKENIKIETMFYKSALFKHAKQAKINERSYGANPSAKSGGVYVQAS